MLKEQSGAGAAPSCVSACGRNSVAFSVRNEKQIGDTAFEKRYEIDEPANRLYQLRIAQRPCPQFGAGGFYLVSIEATIVPLGEKILMMLAPDRDIRPVAAPRSYEKNDPVPILVTVISGRGVAAISVFRTSAGSGGSAAGVSVLPFLLPPDFLASRAILQRLAPAVHGTTAFSNRTRVPWRRRSLWL